MIIIDSFHFIRPFWLLALMPMGYLVWQLMLRRLNSNNWLAACDAHLLPHLLIEKDQRLRKWPLWMLAFIWCIAVVALAGPTWTRQPTPVFQAMENRFIVMDLSLAMNANDVKPNRLTRAKYKVLDILKHVKEGQTGMLVFSQESFVVSPLTHDTATIAAMVPTLEPEIMPVQGSNIGHALVKAGELIHKGSQKQGGILLVTASPVTPEDMKIAEKLNHLGFAISVLGVGTSQGGPIPKADSGFVKNRAGNIIISKLQKSNLRKLAKAGGGSYMTFTNSDRDIVELLKSLRSNEINLEAEKSGASTILWKDQGYWLVFLMLPIALLAFRRGWLTEILK